MRCVYLDTEFTSLNRYTCKLISLALVVPGGPEFYVELIDAWEEGDCSDFVREIVLPQLELATYGCTTEQARIDLLDFLQKLGRVEIISDAPDWDWPLLIWLAGPDGLPGGVEAGRNRPTMLSRMHGCWLNLWRDPTSHDDKPCTEHHKLVTFRTRQLLSRRATFSTESAKV